jgi:hypothetical protein
VQARHFIVKGIGTFIICRVDLKNGQEKLKQKNKPATADCFNITIQLQTYTEEPQSVCGSFCFSLPASISNAIPISYVF